MRLPIISNVFQPKNMVGIDMQPEAIQLVQLKHHKMGYSLQKTAILPIETPIFADGRINDWDRLTGLLYAWVRQLDLLGAPVAIAFPMTQLRLWQVNGLVANEHSVRGYLEQALPGMADAVVADYSVLSSSSVLVAAAKREDVEAYIACFQEAGLQVKVVDVDVFAIQRAVHHAETVVQAGLWQQRNKFTLIWQDEKQMPQKIQWQATQGEQAIAELARQVEQCGVTDFWFCGADYYASLFGKLSFCRAHRYAPPFSGSSINLSDYLLAIGLAMREVPAW